MAHKTLLHCLLVLGTDNHHPVIWTSKSLIHAVLSSGDAESADPVVQQGGARPEMVCSVVSIVAIRCATASLSRNPTPKCFGARCTGFCAPATVELPAEIPARSVFGARCTDFCAWNNGALCPNSGIPARTLIFLFRSGVTFGPGRGTAGGCFVTPCQGVFLI